MPRHVENPVAETGIGPGVAVMGLVRVNDEHLAGHAVRRGTSVSERLNTFERDADGISIVPMRGAKACAAKKASICSIPARATRPASSRPGRTIVQDGPRRRSS